MTKELESVSLRFTSGNSINVDMARVDVKEILSLKETLSAMERKIANKIKLGKETGFDVSHWEEQLLEIKEERHPTALLAVQPAIDRNDGRVRRHEILDLLSLIHWCYALSALIKVRINSRYGAFGR